MIGSAQCQISIQNVFFNGLQLASSVLPLAIAPMVLYYNVNLKDDALSYILFFFFLESIGFREIRRPVLLRLQ